MSVPSPVRLRLLQVAVVELLSSFLPGVGVYWAYQISRDMAEREVVVVRPRSGPTPLAVEGRTRYLGPEDVILRVGTATPDARYFAEVNGLEASTDYAALDTVTTIRNRLRTALDVVAPDAGFTTALAGADGVELTPVNAGGIFALELAGPLTAELGPVSPFKLTTGTRDIALELQALVRRNPTVGQSTYDGALDLIARAISGFHLESTLERLGRDGFSIVDLSAPPVDLTALSGAETESRAAVDVTARARAFAFEPVRPGIERVGLTLTGRLPDNIFTIAEIVAP